jgi:NADH-quinone oxidoreductase subunit J
MIQSIAFYLFGFVLVTSAAMVVTARNPVHSVLFLILAFLNASGLFLLMGAEFLAMILAIVYVGAVAVLFLFVVMMLDVDFEELRAGLARHLPLGAALGLVFLGELFYTFILWKVAPGSEAARLAPMPDADTVTNTAALGKVIYTDNVYLFQVAGLILLVAMIGAIVLTLRHKPDARRQKISDQVARTAAQSVELVEVETGKGI